jgi:hypothetical protein
MATFNITVHPETVQDFETPAFPFYRGCFFRVRATGQIGSGVVCTGRTNPGGWAEMPVAAEEIDWPGRGGLHRRYALIGSIDHGPWFHVGGDYSKLSLTPRGDSGSPVPTTRLRLAINRPHPDRTAAGEGSYAVVVETTEPTGPTEMVCRAVQTELSRLNSNDAPAACEELARTRRVLEEVQRNFIIAATVSGVALTTLVSVTWPIFAPAEIAIQTAQTAAMASVRDAITRGLSSAGALVAAIVDAVTRFIAFLAGRAAAAGTRAATTPINVNPFVAVAVAALALITLAAAAVATAFALSLLTHAADRDNALSNWRSVINGYQTMLEVAREVCPTPPTGTLPTCSAAGA